jgi:hypothetical protein
MNTKQAEVARRAAKSVWQEACQARDEVAQRLYESVGYSLVGELVNACLTERKARANMIQVYHDTYQFYTGMSWEEAEALRIAEESKAKPW